MYFFMKQQKNPDFGKVFEEQKNGWWVQFEISEVTEKKATWFVLDSEVTGSSRWPEVAILAMGQMADRIL